MKSMVVALMLTWGAATGFALDVPKVADLEVALAPWMQTSDPEALKALDAGLTPQLTASADALTWVKAGIVSHNLSRETGSETNPGNATRAVDRLKAAARGPDPELAVIALPYLGSAISLQAKEDSNPVSKIFLVNSAWGTLGEAVDKGGEVSFLPRMIRARVGSSLPDFFGKNHEVLQDVAALDVWDRTHPGRMPDSVRAQLALIRGDTLKKEKRLLEAIAAWTRALALDPQKTGPGKPAAEALDRYAP